MVLEDDSDTEDGGYRDKTTTLGHVWYGFSRYFLIPLVQVRLGLLRLSCIAVSAVFECSGR